MDPITLTALVTALGTQIAVVIRAAKGQKAVSDSVGSPNGLGTVHEALSILDKKMDAQTSQLRNLSDRVEVLERR